MSTITITVDPQGRITGLVVPEGATAQVVLYNGEEHLYDYDPDNDDGLRKTVPATYRWRMGLTSYFGDIGR